jgi:hypothetical protein
MFTFKGQGFMYICWISAKDVKIFLSFAVFHSVLSELHPLLPDPVRTPGPVQPKKFGPWRKN